MNPSTIHFIIDNWGWIKALVIGLLVTPVSSVTVALMLRKRTPEQWEVWALQRPWAAFLTELLKTNGIDFWKNLTVYQRFLQRRAGRIPMDALEKIPLPPVLREALKNPATHAVLVELYKQHQKALDEAAAAANPAPAPAPAERLSLAAPSPSEPTPPAAG